MIAVIGYAVILIGIGILAMLVADAECTRMIFSIRRQVWRLR